jgi:hypothetical protein
MDMIRWKEGRKGGGWFRLVSVAKTHCTVYTYDTRRRESPVTRLFLHSSRKEHTNGRIIPIKPTLSLNLAFS